jgi:hypothetical protein
LAGKESELEPTIVEILLDPQVRQFCAPFIEPWMFQKIIYRNLVETLISREFRDKPVDLKVLRLHMQHEYRDMYSEDWQIIEKLYTTYSPIPSEDIQSVTRIISAFVKDRVNLKGVDLYSRGETKEAEKYFTRATSFNITADPFINPLQDGIIDHLKQKDMPKGGKVIKSSLGLINNASQYGGFKNGDLAMVVLRPKGGKTTFMIQEGATATDQGFKVAHMFLGDYSELDGLHKYMSCLTGDNIANVVNAPNAYKRKCEKWLEHLRIASFPAFGLDCNEIVSYARNLRRKFDFSILVIDYDSNVRPPDDSGMYETGGIMYSTFKGFAQSDECVVLVGCQPKIQYWPDELLGFSSASESSRKQHAVDYMITGGRNSEYVQVGTFHLPLVRRGESSGITRVKYDDLHSRITEISPKEYETLIRDHKDSHKNVKDLSLGGIKFEDKDKQNG